MRPTSEPFLPCAISLDWPSINEKTIGNLHSLLVTSLTECSKTNRPFLEINNITRVENKSVVEPEFVMVQQKKIEGLCGDAAKTIGLHNIQYRLSRRVSEFDVRVYCGNEAPRDQMIDD